MTVETIGTPDVAISALAEVGEGPVWDDRTDRLVWVDILAGSIHETDLRTGDQTDTQLDTLVGAAAPRATMPGFAVAVSDGFGFGVDGVLSVVDPILPEAHRRMNDAKCDSRGRLWAGSTHLEFEPRAGALHRWDGVASEVQASGFTLPNGLGWSPDDATIYLVDNMESVLLQASFDLDDGVVGSFTRLCSIEDGLPDGLTVDIEGNIWIAIWSGSEVRRYDARGNLTGILPMPVSQPTSCAFAADGTLYVTSARSGLTPEQLADQPHAGSVFAVATTTRGVDIAPFAG